ncbi:MAG: hypothetical protein ABJJ03_02180 [Sulfitobacter sp.]
MTPFQMLRRLFWNPDWNETLFLVSCAERIQQAPTDHSITQIKQRILSDIEGGANADTGRWLQFRLVFVHRTDNDLSEEVVFVSDVFPITGGGDI